MWQTYYQPGTLAEALTLLSEYRAEARVVAGGTDVLVELQRGIRPATTLIDVTALSELQYIDLVGDYIAIGALATHNHVLASSVCRHYALPLVQACREVGAPQIRARGTIAGNLVTASPANDTIVPLMALGTDLVLASITGERIVPLSEFYQGVRRTVLQPGELLREIRVPVLDRASRGVFLKLGLRRAQAISVVSIALVLAFDGEYVRDARITLGCLAPTIVHAHSAEAFLQGKRLEPDICEEAGRRACLDVQPIGDLRGSADYRLTTLRTLVSDGLTRLAVQHQPEGWSEDAVLLETDTASAHSDDMSSADATPLTVVKMTINGQSYALPQAQTKTLLNALREDAGLTGTKEGCAEGECGACTVWLNGQAVMSCLVPAAQATGGSVTTIEGLAAMAPDQTLHPLQQAFIDHAAVQCGFCIPGMLMAGAKLLQEHATPDLGQIQTALSGNICRCTGYRKILDAVLAASGQVAVEHPEASLPLDRAEGGPS